MLPKAAYAGILSILLIAVTASAQDTACSDSCGDSWSNCRISCMDQFSRHEPGKRIGCYDSCADTARACSQKCGAEGIEDWQRTKDRYDKDDARLRDPDYIKTTEVTECRHRCSEKDANCILECGNDGYCAIDCFNEEKSCKQSCGSD
jgi:hypothetical protein